MAAFVAPSRGDLWSRWESEFINSETTKFIARGAALASKIRMVYGGIYVAPEAARLSTRETFRTLCPPMFLTKVPLPRWEYVARFHFWPVVDWPLGR